MCSFVRSAERVSASFPPPTDRPRTERLPRTSVSRDAPPYYVQDQVVRARQVFWAHGEETGIEDGPFFAYLLPYREEIAPLVVARKGISLGRIRILDRVPNDGAFIAIIKFSVPSVMPGRYQVAVCNLPCRRTTVADLYGGEFSVALLPWWSGWAAIGSVIALLALRRRRLRARVERPLDLRPFGIGEAAERRSDVLTYGHAASAEDELHSGVLRDPLEDAPDLCDPIGRLLVPVVHDGGYELGEGRGDSRDGSRRPPFEGLEDKGFGPDEDVEALDEVRLHPVERRV